VNKWFNESFMKGIVLQKPRVIETSIVKQTKEYQMYFTNIQQHLSKTVAAKKAALESLPLYHSTVTYASVVKGKQPGKQNDNTVSNIMDVSKESKEKIKNHKEETEKSNFIKRSTANKDNHSTNDNSSTWSKNTVVK